MRIKRRMNFQLHEISSGKRKFFTEQRKYKFVPSERDVRAQSIVLNLLVFFTPYSHKKFWQPCRWLLFLFFLAAVACNSDSRVREETAAPPGETSHSPVPPQGILSEEKVLSDTSQSYFLYIPPHIDTNSLLLVFFDPGAKGKKPVEKYQSLALRHGIILAGSNNSKNGLTGEESAAIAKKFVQDVQGRFRIARANTYACGFSGGARVAVLTAIQENLAGVIGCGAGFPGKPDKNYGFNYVGIVGNEDFNFLELKRLYYELERARMKHQLLVFDGKHEWPPEKELEKAVLILENAPSVRESLASRIDSSVTAYKKEKNWIRVYDELLLGITSGLDSAHINRWKKGLSLLRKNADCIAVLKKEAEIEAKEAEMQTEIARAFPAKNFTYLEHTIENLKQPPSRISALEKLSDKRLLQFVSLMGFLYSEKALASDKVLAKKYLDIYGKADAANPDYHYLMACYHALAKDKSAALASLAKAADAGFDDVRKLQSNAALQTLQPEPEFSAILQRIAGK